MNCIKLDYIFNRTPELDFAAKFEWIQEEKEKPSWITLLFRNLLGGERLIKVIGSNNRVKLYRVHKKEYLEKIDFRLHGERSIGHIRSRELFGKTTIQLHQFSGTIYSCELPNEIPKGVDLTSKTTQNFLIYKKGREEDLTFGLEGTSFYRFVLEGSHAPVVGESVSPFNQRVQDGNFENSKFKGHPMISIRSDELLELTRPVDDRYFSRDESREIRKKGRRYQNEKALIYTAINFDPQFSEGLTAKYENAELFTNAKSLPRERGT